MAGTFYQYHSHLERTKKEFVSASTQTDVSTPLDLNTSNNESHTPLKNINCAPITRSSPRRCAKRTLTTTNKQTQPVCSVTKRKQDKVMDVVGCPGKKQLVKGYKCQECKIKYESEADKIFRKGKERKTTWIGCDKTRCTYWAHAICAKLQLKQRVPVEEHQFLCLTHRKR